MNSAANTQASGASPRRPHGRALPPRTRRRAGALPRRPHGQAPPPQARGRAGAPPRTGFIYSQSQRRNKVTRPIQAQGYSPAREVIRARMDLQSPVHASAAAVGGGDRASRREKTSGWCGRVWWRIPSPAVRSPTARHGGFWGMEERIRGLETCTGRI